jgi:hypothetical protein
VGGASAVALAVVLGVASLVAGCSGRRPIVAEGEVINEPQRVALAESFLLEVSGVAPPDTVVTMPAGVARVIVLRHGPPDNAVFAEVAFDSSSFQAPAGTPVEVTVRPRPGLYGVELTSSVPFTGAQLTFKYAVHFSAPAAAVQRYGTELVYERALAIGLFVDGRDLLLLPSSRPASDNLRATLPSPGTYMVAAPR